MRPRGLQAPILSLLLLAAGELTFQWLGSDPAHEYPRNWHSQDVNHKLELADARAGSDGRVDLLALGHSAAEAGFDPALLEEDGIEGFNFALPGSTVNFQALLLDSVLMPRYEPDTVLWGVIPGVFWVRIHAGQYEKILGGPSERALREGGFEGRLNYELLQRVGLLNYRINLKAWLGVVTAAPGPEEAARLQEHWNLSEEQYEQMRAWAAFLPRVVFEVDELGYRPLPEVFQLTAPRDLETARKRMVGMTVDEEWLAPFRDTIRRCEERGVRVVLVNLPTAPGWELQLPEGALEEHRRAMQQVADQTGAEFLDLFRLDQTRYPTELYADSVHANVEGAARMTRDIQAFLRGS